MIKEMIERIVEQKINVQVKVATVKSVDTDQMTCDLSISGSPDLLDVRLRSVIDGAQKGVLIVPEKNSMVLVGIIDNRPENAFVCAYSAVKSIHLLTDDIALSGDQYGGLVKIEALVSKLNNIENAVNQLKASFNGHTHIFPLTPTTPVLTQTPVVPSTINMVNTQKADLENPKVKHG